MRKFGMLLSDSAPHVYTVDERTAIRGVGIGNNA